MTSPFSPRPFPPPTLADVPIEYIIEQLRNLAPYYWQKPETADCTIIVPIPHIRQRPTTSPSSSPPKFRHSIDFHPSAAGGRITESSLNNTPRLTFNLHMDYLSAHSSYLRALFSGACPMDLINSRTSLSSPDSTPQYSVPPDRLPKLLSSIHDHPILYLPVPDPTSFHLLIHWMYFNQISVISEALHDGSILWEGIARNVEYLGLSAEIKLFLTKWYHTWLDPVETVDDHDSESESETECGYLCDGEDSCTTAVDMDELIELDNEKEPARGRPRTTRPRSVGSRTPST